MLIIRKYLCPARVPPSFEVEEILACELYSTNYISLGGEAHKIPNLAFEAYNKYADDNMHNIGHKKMNVLHLCLLFRNTK